MHPVIVSTTSLSDKLPLSSLDQVLETDITDPLFKGKQYRVRINVLVIEDAAQPIKVLNTKTGTLRDQKGAVSKDEKQVVSVTFLAQDYSLALSNQVVRVKLTDATGEFFNGEVGKKLDKVNQALKTMQRFNVWVEGILSFNAQGALELSHTQLKTF